jgi:hypothetical protein
MQQSSLSGNNKAPLFLKLVTPAVRARSITKLKPAKSSVFILSTGRTGTKFLADVTNQLPGIDARHEPKPTLVLQAWTSAFLEGKVSDDYMRSVLYGKRHKLLKDVDVDIYIESNHFIDGFVTHLNDVFENPTIIHIVRDPRDFITSMINRGNDSGLKLLINKYVPYWAYAPAGVKRHKMTALQREAEHWQAMNRVLSEYGKSHDNYHFYKFEDVFSADKPKLLKDLYKKMGLSDKQIAQLDMDRAEKNKSRIAAMPAWQEWSAADRKQVQAICGDLMATYGYGTEAEWLQSVK